jgi:uncharacterized protein (DUF1501 family)
VTAPATAPGTTPVTACPECVTSERRRLVSRRQALLGGLGGLGTTLATGTLTAVDTRVAFAAGPGSADTVVVLSLRGGFDGLSAVPPVGDPAFAALRPGIGVSRAAALPLDGLFGLHPALSALKPWYDNGSLAVVHATGLPAPNRSHFDATEELERAAPGSSLRTGWLDRMLALGSPDGPFGAVQLGSTSMPLSLLGPFPALGMTSVDDFGLDGADADSRPAWEAFLAATHDLADVATSRAVTDTLGALDRTAAMAEAGYSPGNGADYPDSDLGKALRDVARLVKADVGLRVATLDVGDWDMHVGLGTPGSGWMHDKLTDLGAALAAFATDLGPFLGDVTLVTLSEFGRRAEENDSAGVDHGWGNAAFVLGGGVNGGRVVATWPGLDGSGLTDGDLTVTTDYRAVLADILSHRVGASAGAISEVFPGWSGSSLSLTAPRT